MKTIAGKAAVASAVMALVLGAAAPAGAALDVGQRAPAFSAPAALGGKPFTYSLSTALARGPVVVYFFPAAFTQGCSIEAHAFAEAIDQFAALGATVIGVSTDDIDTLAKFSSQACQGKFPVASDADKTISKSFDAIMQTRPDYATRVSYVIAPDGTVAAQYQSLNPEKHVEKMLDGVRALPRRAAAR
ncbi:peroxiredoxin [Variovorax ureilyticus]|uniref:thioredoxin-dependent peroxiredoxin n=1 Tax=Variovorax ureilyticus TaxID=1836198 RepID=A0ABU8VJ50_9BURK